MDTRTVGNLRFIRYGLRWDVYNLRHGKWVFIGALDNHNRHPYIEPDDLLVNRAVALAKRRHERLEGVL